MFRILGNVVARAWVLFLTAWVLLLAGTWYFAPPWEEVAQDKEFGFLPANAPSRTGEEVFRKAFPDDQHPSNVVLVLHDPGGTEAGNVERDRKFIDDVLVPRLRKIADAEGGLADEPRSLDEAPGAGEDPFAESAQPSAPKPHSIMARIRTPNAPGGGSLLVSPDGQALMVVVDLTTSFMAHRNWPVLTKIEDLVADLKRQGQLPPGVDVAVTGSAVVGRDHSWAEMQSVRATEFLTFVLVIALLVLIYRAPLLALIPLLTVFLAVQVSINTLAILAGRGYLSLFQGIQIYITILAYGAGIDYCLFLTARYKEELDRGLQPAEAVARAIGDVGHTVLASAATVIGGIAMMVFARFGKFHDAGIAIPLSLVLVLCATLTFSPTLLRLAGRWAFWPDGRHAQATAPLATGPAAAKTAAGAKGFFAPERIHQVWENLGAALQRRPGTVWLACVAALAPLVVLGGLFRNRLSYDLIGSLPADAPSVTGTHVLEQHFPAGVMGPVTVLLLDPQVDFGTDEGRHLVAKLTDRLRQRREELGLNDVRSLTAPLGLHVDPSQAFASLHLPAETERELLERGGLRQYTSDMGERARVATRLDLVFEQSPFSHTSVADLDRVEETVRSSLPSGLRRGSRLYFTGPTPSVRDLQDVVRGDRTRIELLVLGSVFVILLLLLRQVVVPLYLLLSVLFSYYATLGITFALFWALDPHGFYGIDWKVAIFLFTILIAVGEDYNIFLIGRVGEESRRQGPVRGITEALARTGPIISSCGIIMAGTFASLLGGSLAEMKQLGFALAFGILLDTFLVRPVLVPSFLLLLAGFRLPPLAGFGRKPGTDPALKSG